MAFNLGLRFGLGAIPKAVMTATSFDPASWFAASEQGAWYDPSDFSTLFQDAAGTTPVTAVGQSVGLMLDKSGRGNHASQVTQTKRPVLQVDGNGCYYLLADGVDDSMTTSAVNLTGTARVTVVVGIRKLADTAYPVIVESYNLSTYADFGLHASGAASVTGYLGGVTQAPTANVSGQTQNNNNAPVTNVVTASYWSKGSALVDTAALRVNGIDQALTDTSAGTPVTTNNFSNAPFALFHRINNGGGTPALFFNGRFYGAIVRGAVSTPAEIANAEAWMNTKTKAY